MTKLKVEHNSEKDKSQFIINMRSDIKEVTDNNEKEIDSEDERGYGKCIVKKLTEEENISDAKKSRLKQWTESMAAFCVGTDKSYDDKLLYISAGVAVLSIGYLPNFRLLGVTEECIQMYIWGIIIVAMCVLVNLITFPISKIIARHYILVNNEIIAGNYKQSNKADIDKQEKILYRLSMYTNWICYLFIVAGVVCLCIPIFYNI